MYTDAQDEYFGIHKQVKIAVHIQMVWYCSKGIIVVLSLILMKVNVRVTPLSEQISEDKRLFLQIKIIINLSRRFKTSNFISTRRLLTLMK